MRIFGRWSARVAAYCANEAYLSSEVRSLGQQLSQASLHYSMHNNNRTVESHTAAASHEHGMRTFCSEERRMGVATLFRVVKACVLLLVAAIGYRRA